MSSVPNATQNNASNSNNKVNGAAAPAPEIDQNDPDLLFRLRTFDVYWVDKYALMYRDGIAKVSKQLFADYSYSLGFTSRLYLLTL